MLRRDPFLYTGGLGDLYILLYEKNEIGYKEKQNAKKMYMAECIV